METLADGYTLEQEARVVRAAREAGDMSWSKAPNGWVVTTAGGCYLVTEQGSCTCLDYQYRLAGTTGRCKHAIGLSHRLLAHQTREEVVSDEWLVARRKSQVTNHLPLPPAPVPDPRPDPDAERLRARREAARARFFDEA